MKHASVCRVKCAPAGRFTYETVAVVKSANISIMKCATTSRMNCATVGTVKICNCRYN